eukprot:TRINITY_DN5246_c0_g1_i1.p1 TRINITY_DN5246_c0_g1~~TRINITY_DN5246_c0_g1_i1.p1  ORF type:complete len:273 (+),score=69.39 TRINITY_DN5246_c0_g1_i1:72-821(+)
MVHHTQKALYISGVRRHEVERFLVRGYAVRQQRLVSKDYKEDGLMDLVVTHTQQKLRADVVEKVADFKNMRLLYNCPLKGDDRKVTRVVMLQVAFGSLKESALGISNAQLMGLLCFFNEVCGTNVHPREMHAAPAKKALDVMTVYLQVEDPKVASRIANAETPALNGKWYELVDGETSRWVTLHTLQTSPKPYVYANAKKTRAAAHPDDYYLPTYTVPYASYVYPPVIEHYAYPPQTQYPTITVHNPYA